MLSERQNEGGTEWRLYQGFKRLSINVEYMRNKLDDLERLLWEGGYNLVGITETWWDEIHEWNAVIKW